ncbi:putative uncharacterized protein DDB_G0271606 isoform X1 [Drosophila serrata]|uniref:putative uncharacterized protein DDB_G0271606 isoform X1 n=1 Tax=Drosophila serrata TaxID=7274 RepID=UPI000A1D33DD|nr:putative uncharacterized protein DDB_G0271606 isoform X1 [Drosophila serrata]XP_020800471.1 putative uncharacterized protein DDB_G0271606 isoform X1 [Drosophila serrata]
MAATPPMPPGSNAQHHVSHVNGIVKQSNGQVNQLTEAINQHFQRKNQQKQKHNSSTSINPNPNQSPNPNSPGGSRCGSNEQLELLEPQHPQEATVAAAGKAKLSCHCTNISIMHLFHEMKQEFPTIPDAIVTQCVNENCHQRENCIQMLRKELALHPIPVQSYPAKVLQQQQQQQQQQQHQQQQQIRPAKPPTPLKPSRSAPPQPDFSQSNGIGGGSASSQANLQPRPRPTTLNLQRQVSTQLQQKIQQRQQRHQKDQQPQQLTPTSLSKPLRRAPPLPPPPKPNPNPKPGSFSNDSSCLTSPMSSSESELSLNAAVFLSSPTTAATTAVEGAPIATAQPQPQPQAQLQLQPQQPSPVRHRSVITLQPEPPYARDFLTSSGSSSSGLTTTTSPPTIATPPLPSPSSAASPVAAAGGRKSFTSLNLTLRQPTTGPAQSAIDITAGPAPSGQGSGITYSSVSFDARRGTHKNFQLTVTEEGSVFSAGCIRPRVPYTELGCDPAAAAAPSPPTNQPPPSAAASAVLASDGHGDEMQMDVFPYPTQAQNHIVASNYSNNHVVTDNNNGNGSSSVDSSPTMPLYVGVLEDCDREAHAATIQRQKQRRDKLANALRDNKKRLLVLEQEINILTEPVPVGESERLDRDIKKLAEDCQQLNQLLNRINAEPQANDSVSGSAPNSMNRQNSAPASQQQHQPPPRQRPGGRAQAPPNSLRLHSVPAVPTTGQPIPDFGQHQQHSSAPTSACLTPQQQLHQEPPPTYAQYYQFQQYLHQQRQQQLQQLQVQQQQQQILQQQQQQRAVTEEEEFQSDSDAEAEETLDSWACNMCTFRNHPQLNICEACDYVRIQPGMLHFVPPASATAAAGGGGAGDQQQQQQQPPQQPYALHT